MKTAKPRTIVSQHAHNEKDVYMNWMLLYPSSLRHDCTSRRTNNNWAAPWGWRPLFCSRGNNRYRCGVVRLGPFAPDSAPEFSKDFRWASLRWWMIIPGICGFAVVIGIPWAIPQLVQLKCSGYCRRPATRSVLWDALFEDRTQADCRRCHNAYRSNYYELGLESQSPPPHGHHPQLHHLT